jgi:hypothetical protein
MFDWEWKAFVSSFETSQGPWQLFDTPSSSNMHPAAPPFATSTRSTDPGNLVYVEYFHAFPDNTHMYLSWEAETPDKVVDVLHIAARSFRAAGQRYVSEIQINGINYSPRELGWRIQSNVDRINLDAPWTAMSGDQSFAAHLATQTKTTVDGFLTEVYRPSSNVAEKAFNASRWPGRNLVPSELLGVDRFEYTGKPANEQRWNHPSRVKNSPSYINGRRYRFHPGQPPLDMARQDYPLAAVGQMRNIAQVGEPISDIVYL